MKLGPFQERPLGSLQRLARRPCAGPYPEGAATYVPKTKAAVPGHDRANVRMSPPSARGENAFRSA